MALLLWPTTQLIAVRHMPRAPSQQAQKSQQSRMRGLRDTLGLNQREMALEFNVSHGAIAGWESGKRIPGPVLKLLELYEEELGLDPLDVGLRGLKVSRGARGLSLSRAGLTSFASVGALIVERMRGEGAEQGVITQRAHRAIAKNLRETLGQMKGVAMTLGQVLAYADFAVPEAARSELKELLTSSAPLAPTVVARLVLEELGQTPRQLFADWSPSPLAAASIGQVHRARLRSGELVAVKVQYPAIVNAVEADLARGALVDRLATLLFRGQEQGAWFSELAERFREECDYRVEAANQEHFRKLWEGRPGVRIPRVHRELSTQRLLVTELITAQSFGTFLSGATQDAKNQAGIRIWQFAFESIFRHGLFNTDPHPGNYLFSEQGEVAFLDFGCVKRFSTEHVACWKALIRAILERDFASAKKLVQAMGMVSKGCDFDYHMALLVMLHEPWLTDEVFELSPRYVASTWRALTADNPNRFRLNVPKDWVSVNRLYWGLYAVLAQLGVQARFRPLMLDLVYEPGEPRPMPYTSREIAAHIRRPHELG